MQGLTLMDCPFCASVPVVNKAQNTGVIWISCSECTAEKGAFNTIEEAILDWNRRANAGAQDLQSTHRA